MKLNLTDSTVVFDRQTILHLLEIEEFKGSWKAYGNLAPDRLTELQRIATIESIGSSTRIEGAKLSDKEVARILAGLSTQSFTTRDEQEVAGYAFLMNEIYDSWEEMPLTETSSNRCTACCFASATRTSDIEAAIKTSRTAWRRSITRDMSSALFSKRHPLLKLPLS